LFPSLSTYEDANRYLKRIFIPKYNRYFGVPSNEAGTAFMPVVGANLNRIFALRYERVVSKDNTVHLDGMVFQLPKISGVSTLAKRKVELREHLDGKWEVLSGKRLVARFNLGAEIEAVSASVLA